MHTGSIDGMSAIIGLMPDERIGVYVLANIDHAELRHALMYQAIDICSGNPPRDWSTELRALLVRIRSRPPRRRRQRRLRRASAPSLPLERYAGTYVDSAYGSFEISQSGSVYLRARFRGADVGELESVQGETFRSQDPTRPAATRLSMTFVIGAAGAVTGIRAFGITFDLVRK